MTYKGFQKCAEKPILFPRRKNTGYEKEKQTDELSRTVKGVLLRDCLLYYSPFSFLKLHEIPGSTKLIWVPCLYRKMKLTVLVMQTGLLFIFALSVEYDTAKMMDWQQKQSKPLSLCGFNFFFFLKEINELILFVVLKFIGDNLF